MMLLTFCLDHSAMWNLEVSRAALADTEAALQDLDPPFEGLGAAHVESLLWSQLYRQVWAQGMRRLELPDSTEVPRLETLDAPSPAEYARLISKGRLLFEHCMTEVSNACVIGFMDHELGRSRRARRVVFDLVAWMVEQRLEIVDVGSDEECDVADRLSHADYMIDIGVSLLHGLSRDQARHLAADIAP